MPNLLPKRNLTGLLAIFLPVLAAVGAIPCSAFPKRLPAKSGPAIIRQACDDNLVVKYNAVLDRYKAQMKNPKGMLVNAFEIKATPEDRDSLRHWYSLMTNTQQYHIWAWPGDNGKFVPSPFSVFEDEKGRARAGGPGKWITREQGTHHAYNYLLVLDGEVVNRRVRLASFNADKATAAEFGALIKLQPYQMKRIEVVKRDKAMEKWGYRGCNGAIVITTNKKYLDKYLIVVDGKVVDRTRIRYPWLYADSTSPEDFEEFMSHYGIAVGNVNSIELMRGADAVRTWGSKGRDGAVLITTMSDLKPPLILVDGKVARVGLKRNFNVTDMTINDYARLLGLNPLRIKSFKVTGNSTKKGEGLSCAKGDVMVEITTK